MDFCVSIEVTHNPKHVTIVLSFSIGQNSFIKKLGLSHFHIFENLSIYLANIFVTKFQNQNYTTPASEASWGAIILLGKNKRCPHFLLTRCSDFYARHRFNKIHASKNVLLFNIIA
jgi:hypothetical protein